MAAFQYAVKVVCGVPGAAELAPGIYFTAINVHNPTERDIEFRKKIARAGREDDERVRPSEFIPAKLGPDQAFEMDCPDIRKLAQLPDAFLKGFAVLESDAELDVVAVYSAAARGRGAQVSTLHLERVQPRRA